MLLLLTVLFLLRLICITHCLFSSFCNSSTHLYKKLPIYTASYRHKTKCVSYFFGIQKGRTVDMGTCHSRAEIICKAGNWRHQEEKALMKQCTVSANHQTFYIHFQGTLTLEVLFVLVFSVTITILH